ncbi:MAG: cyclophilin-like fold protein [Actinomycetes bacterium]
MTHILRRTGIAATAIELSFTAACTTSQSTEEPGAGGAASASNSPETTDASSETGSAAPDGTDGDSALRLRITVGDGELTASLRDRPASRDLIAMLPLTVDMSDHGSVEKTGRLPAPLSLDGQPEGADPVVGDIGYYAPGNDLVLYYGDQEYFAGIVRLGALHGDVDALAEGDEVSVRVQRAGR